MTEDNVDITAVFEPNKGEIALNAIAAEIRELRISDLLRPSISVQVQS